jgi:hypothetical protein
MLGWSSNGIRHGRKIVALKWKTYLPKTRFAIGIMPRAPRILYALFGSLLIFSPAMIFLSNFSTESRPLVRCYVGERPPIKLSKR